MTEMNDTKHILLEEERERLKKSLQSIAILAVSAQSQLDLEDVSTTLDDIEYDLKNVKKEVEKLWVKYGD